MSFKHFLFVVAVIISLASCSDQTDAAQLIPQSSRVVMSIDVKSLAEKAQLEDRAEEMSSMKAMEVALQNENAELYQVYQDFMEDPKSAGIDLRDPIYIFELSGDDGSETIAVSMDIWDEDDFVKTAKALINSSKMEIEESEADGFRTLMVKGQSGSLIAYDDDRAVMLNKMGMGGSENDMLRIASELMGDEGSKMTDDPHFEEFLSNAGDVNVFSNTGALMQTGAAEMIYGKFFSEDYMELLKDSGYRLHLNFLDDRIELISHAFFNDKMQESIDEMGLEAAEVDEALLSYLPGNGFMSASMGMNKEGLYNYITKIFSDETINQPEVQKMLQEYRIKEIMDALELNMAFTMIDIREEEVEDYYVSYTGDSIPNTRMEPAIDYAAIMKHNDRDLVTEMLRDKMPMVKDGEDGLMMMGEESQPNYISITDNSIFLSNDKALATGHQNGQKYQQNLSGTETGKAMASNAVYLGINLDLNSISAAKENMPPQARKLLGRWDDFLERAEYSQKNLRDGRVSIFVNSDGKNSLAKILELGEETYKETTGA